MNERKEAEYKSFNQSIVREFQYSMEPHLVDFLNKHPMTLEEITIGILNFFLGVNCEIPTSQLHSMVKGYLPLVMERRRLNEIPNQ